MKATLYDDTPIHSSHYLKLIEEGYFNGTLFHRVINNFVIQGGAGDSRNAPEGAQIEKGREDMELMPEFRPNRIHKKGAIAAPRRGDDENPLKKSDASQLYIVQGKRYSPAQLDTLEMRLNRPLRQKLFQSLYARHKEALNNLMLAGNADGLQKLLDSISLDVDSIYAISPERIPLTQQQKETYSTVGGTGHLDGGYTVFGEITEGFDVIDKIASQPTDANDRPITEAKIIRIYTE